MGLLTLLSLTVLVQEDWGKRIIQVSIKFLCILKQTC